MQLFVGLGILFCLATVSGNPRDSRGRTNGNGGGRAIGRQAQSQDLNRFRYDAEKRKYIRLGTTENCNENMRFFAVQLNETAGQCDCDYYQCSRPLLYSPKTNQCYFAWSQGPCAQGEWYTFDAALKPVCEPRACTEGLADEPVTAQTVSLSFWFKNPRDGKCYESGSQGYCTGEDESLLIVPGEPIPECRESTVCVPLARPEPQLCLPGNRRSYELGC